MHPSRLCTANNINALKTGNSVSLSITIVYRRPWAISVDYTLNIGSKKKWISTLSSRRHMIEPFPLAQWFCKLKRMYATHRHAGRPNHRCPFDGVFKGFPARAGAGGTRRNPGVDRRRRQPACRLLQPRQLGRTAAAGTTRRACRTCRQGSCCTRWRATPTLSTRLLSALTAAPSPTQTVPCRYGA